MTFPLLEQMIFQALGGLGLFMLGMHFLSDGIRALAAARMRSIMERLARNRITAVLTGAFVTGVVQSSSVVTVMIVGFVNSGVVNLEQAVGLVMGANIGTTVTSIFIALPIAKYGLPVLGASALVYIFSPHEKTHHASIAVLGLGMIFFGLQLMTSGFRPIREMPELLALFAAFDAETVLGIVQCAVFGALVTAVIQSSSAMIGIIMGLATSGVLAWQTSLAIVLGAEIGTCVTSILAASTLSINSRRTSYAHLGFNLIGVTIATMIFPLYEAWSAFLVGGDPGVPKVIKGMTIYPLAPLAIAGFVTSYNIFNTLMLLPWVPQFTRLLTRIGSGRSAEIEDLSVPRFLFGKALEEPEMAISLLEKEQVRYRQALSGLLDGVCRPEQSSPRALATLRQSLDSLNREIIDFGERLCSRDLAANTATTVIDRLQTQETSTALVQGLLFLAETWDNNDLTEVSRQALARWIEALDALVQETVSALAETDAQQLEMLGRMTAQQGPNLETMRRRYLEDSDHFSARERQLLLAALGQIEGCIWLLNRLCR